MTRPRIRRAKGSGKLDRQRSGRWRARLPSGRRAMFDHRKDAEEWLAREQAKAVLSPEVRAVRSDLRLVDLEAGYFADLTRRQRRDSTVDGYRSHWAIVVERWGELRVDLIDGPRLEELVEEMAQLGWAPATIGNRLSMVTGAMRWAMRRGLIAARPLPVIRPAVTVASRPEPYTDAEATRLLAAASALSRRCYAAVLLGLDAGLRRSEIWSVQHEDLMGQQLVLPVRSAADQPKSGRERWVPVTSRLVASLEHLTPRRGPIVGDGDRTHVEQLTRECGPAWAAAGLGGARWHRLRHTWATALAESGAHPYDLLAWGGWARMDMVLRYYHARQVNRGPVDALEQRWGRDRSAAGPPARRRKRAESDS